MGTGKFTHNSWYTKTLKTLLKTHIKVLKTSNLAYTMLLVQGRILQQMWFSMCPMAVLVSQGIVVKYADAIIFCMMAWDQASIALQAR